MYQLVDQKDFLSDILRESDRFRAFFTSAHVELPPNLQYAVSGDLPDGVRGTVARDASGPIMMTPALPRGSDGHTVAHELVHLVLEQRGFPAVGSKGSANPATAFLNSALLDPLVEQTLASHHFNVLKKFKSDGASLVRQHGASQPPRRPYTLGFVLAPLKYRLMWPRIQPGRVDIHFWSPLSRQDPDFAELVGELADCIETSGYDDPVAMGEAMEMLRTLLGLDEVTTPPAVMR